MKKYITLLPLLFLVGCKTLTVIDSRTVEVKVPIAISCKSEPIYQPPTLFGTLRKEDDIHTKTKIILAELENKIAYEKQLEASIKGCQ